MSNSYTIKSLACLKLVDILDLVDGKITALILDEVVSASVAAAFCRKNRKYHRLSNYTWKSDLTSTNPSIGEAHESAQKEREYFESVASGIEISRDIYGTKSPVDIVTQQINKVWENGIIVPEKNGQKFLPEISRRWRENGGAHPHLDQANTHILSGFGIKVRLGLNVYLNMAPQGGEIEFWKQFLSDKEYKELKRPDYGIDRHVLGEPDAIVRPKVGQAVLFRADRPHAVAPINQGVEMISSHDDRITNACFLCVTAKNAPLLKFA